MLVNDNLELGCSIIERAATDKAVRDIDKSLATAYEARATARARGQPFYERALYAQSQSGRFPAALPESLKPKPGLPQQQRVYEDFARLPRALPPHPLAGPTMPPASSLQVRFWGRAGDQAARLAARPLACQPARPPAGPLARLPARPPAPCRPAPCLSARPLACMRLQCPLVQCQPLCL